ncbi:UNVERIFIED_ORG: hypothetical protein J2X80_003120 [Pseudomonas fluorescens]|uniref:hypothetical protein n=1 Tax=Pseudomonas TaxID=286 RepID=UPI0007E33B20|nr:MULTISPECIES: hypothetical protein [unclassified Pseudomonas]MDP9711030.1 hypothetical protein [Pseudomonas fluorescens]QZD69056.1 hypothetical protein K3819_17585 [Pseudomonas sp. 3-2]
MRLLHVVVLNNCYAKASQRGEAAKTGRLLDDVFRVDHKRLENFRQRFSSLYWTFRPGQLLQSALWAACIRKKQLGGQTSLLKRVASAPDRGDVCIMQKQNDAVNGFVVIIFGHYILSDKVILE